MHPSLTRTTLFLLLMALAGLGAKDALADPATAGPSMRGQLPTDQTTHARPQTDGVPFQVS